LSRRGKIRSEGERGEPIAPVGERGFRIGSNFAKKGKVPERGLGRLGSAREAFKTLHIGGEVFPSDAGRGEGRGPWRKKRKAIEDAKRPGKETVRGSSLLIHSVGEGPRKVSNEAGGVRQISESIRESASFGKIHLREKSSILLAGKAVLS